MIYWSRRFGTATHRFTMAPRGRLIVIEGLDRSGKSTQAERLLRKLETKLGAGEVKLLKFPGVFSARHRDSVYVKGSSDSQIERRQLDK